MDPTTHCEPFEFFSLESSARESHLVKDIQTSFHLKECHLEINPRAAKSAGSK